MLDYTLSADKLGELRAAHRSTQDKREADRIKAVVLLAAGWTAEDVAEVVLVDPNTLRSHFKCYRQGGTDALCLIGTGVGGSACMLDADQLVSEEFFGDPRKYHRELRSLLTANFAIIG